MSETSKATQRPKRRYEVFEIELLAGMVSSQKASQEIVSLENLSLHAAAPHCI
jgi:hypothetical protein